jgi:hypothetical protein
LIRSFLKKRSKFKILDSKIRKVPKNSKKKLMKRRNSSISILPWISGWMRDR